MSECAIELAALGKAYGAFIAVDKLSLNIPVGAVYGLLGPNGAGKTTTFRMICGFLRPDAGSVRIFGLALGHPDLLHGRMAALPQDAILPGHYTVMGFLCYMARLQHFGSARAAEEARRVLSLVGLLDEAERPTRALSHGMARRVALAQAFLGSPDLILLDEPTSGLDPRHAHQVRGLIDELRGSSTVLVASHNLAEVQQLCDHVAIIDKGRLVAAGKTADICRATESLHLEIDAARVDTAALEKAVGVRCSWEARGGKLLVELPVDGKRDIEAVNAEVLRWLLERGLSIRSLRRGESLEQRYLDLT